MIREYLLEKSVNIFSLSGDFSIIEGTPLLYLNRQRAIVLGDIHLGHETIILGDEIPLLSPPTKKLRELLVNSISRFSVRTVIFNGDIKHLSYGVSRQEKVELSYIFEDLVSRTEVILIRGNHDSFLKFSLNNRLRSSLEIVKNLDLGDTFITHGDQDLTMSGDWNNIVLSHEHPAFVFIGRVGEKIKLPSFANFKGFIDGRERNFVILPAASMLAGGVSFPPHSARDFLSPLLKRVKTPFELFLYPYDPSIGILPLPPIIVE